MASITYAKQILCSRSHFFVSVFLRAVFSRENQRFIYFFFVNKSITSYVPCTSSVGLWVVQTIQDLGSILAPVHPCQKMQTQVLSHFAKACPFRPPLYFLTLGLRTLIAVFLLREYCRRPPSLVLQASEKEMHHWHRDAFHSQSWVSVIW